MQSPMTEDVRPARRQRRDQAICDPQLAAETDGSGLLHEHRVGSAIDDPAIDPIGVNDTARTIGCFEDAYACAAALQLVGGGEARDASSDNRYVDEIHIT
jgi:hypothetical protein